MSKRLPLFQGKSTLVLGAATLTLLWLPGSTHAQSTTMQGAQSTTMQGAQSTATQGTQSAAMQDRQAPQTDDVTRADLARFDQFLDSHHEIAVQLRRTPSLIDDPQYLQSHPELSAYLQAHPSVKQEISQQPNTFMRLEDAYDRDHGLRDRDAGGQDRDARSGDVANFDRFLDAHREIAEQVRKDPSLLDNRSFVQNHPELQNYLQDNPGVRDQIRQNPNAFMQQEDAYDRDSNLRDRDAGGQDRDVRSGAANFDRFLDGHREIAEQVRKDPSLLDNRSFVQNHPELQAYLQDNPGVRDQVRQNPNAFMQQEDAYDRNSNPRDRDAMQDRMANFGGFLGSHPDIQKDLSRDASVVKDHDYMENHAELNTYLNAHPDVRDGLMANPQSFVQGAQQYKNSSATGTAGAGMSGRGTGGTGSWTGTSSWTGTGATKNPPATTIQNSPTTPQNPAKPE